ncbi:MAG: hypothetical protein HQL32_01580 [Planctomycetes bacterium]|nr:hypothetical protein [Planctomycetota bacterium]
MKEPRENLLILEEKPAFKAQFKQPIALLSDLELILGRKAQRNEDQGYSFIFQKEKISDRLPWQFNVWVDKQNRVTSFRFPKRLTKILGNHVLLDGIRAVGYCEVSINKKTLYLEMKERVSREQMLELLGAPQKQKENHYNFDFISGESKLLIEIKCDHDIEWLRMSCNNYSLDLSFKKKKID